VIVACNAASSALFYSGEEFYSIPFHSIIPSALRLIEGSVHDRIGILGGNRTIESGIYQNALIGSKKKYFFKSAQPLSAFVEGQWRHCRKRNKKSAVIPILNRLDTVCLYSLSCAGSHF
jgi:glutamate racemase